MVMTADPKVVEVCTSNVLVAPDDCKWKEEELPNISQVFELIIEVDCNCCTGCETETFAILELELVAVTVKLPRVPWSTIDPWKT